MHTGTKQLKLSKIKKIKIMNEENANDGSYSQEEMEPSDRYDFQGIK